MANCHKHGSYSVFCRYCDMDIVAEHALVEHQAANPEPQKLYSYHVAYKRTANTNRILQDRIEKVPSVKKVVEIIEAICTEEHEIIYIIKVEPS